MTGLQIDFTTSTLVLNPAVSITGFNTTVQNAVVNIATQRGTDNIYSDKGTTILAAGVHGLIVGMNTANHQAQLAASNTLYFSREYETSPDAGVVLDVVNMQPVTYTNFKLQISASFTNLSGTGTVGTITTL